jgi:DNA-binding HxlR family transcriptional regulator
LSSSNDLWKAVRITGLAHTPEILESIYENPRRFKDLETACPNQSTRIERLRSLEEVGYVETQTVKIKGRTAVQYKLTPKGRKAVEHLLSIKKLFSEQKE